MNQNIQMVQTLLILGLCIAVVFVLGRSSSQDSPSFSDSPGSTLALMQIRDTNERLRRFEEKMEAQKTSIQTLISTHSQLEKSLEKLMGDIQKENKATNQQTQRLQEVEKSLITLKQDIKKLKLPSSTQPPLKKVEEKKVEKVKKIEKKDSKAVSLSHERQATELLEKLKPDFFDYLALKKYDDARYKLSNFPKGYRQTRAGREAAALLKQIDRAIDEDFETSEKRAREYIRKGQLESAMQLLRGAKERFPGRPDIHQKAKNAMAYLQEEWKRIGRSAIYNAPQDEEIQALIEEMGSDNFKKALEARKSLARIGRRGIIEIRKATENENPRVRWGAVVLIGQMEDEESESILTTALRDQDPQVRHSALDALENLKSYQAIEEVIKTVGDEDFKVALRAIKVFENITEHTVTLKSIAITADNIKNVKEMMEIYWEKNRGKFINS